MKNQQKAKRHHFVPQCYLKNFVKGGNLYALDIRKVANGIPHKVKRVQTASVCYIENYYKIHSGMLSGEFKLDDLDELFIESQVLTILEEKYAKHIYPKLVTNDFLSREEACDLADFILQLKFRNPFHFKSMEAQMPKMIDEVLDRLSSDISDHTHRFAHIPNQIKRLLIGELKLKTKSDALFSKKMQLSRLAEQQIDNPKSKEKLRNAIINVEWWLLQSPKEGPFFVTSDNPGFAIGRDQLNYNTKFIDGFAFYLPISPLYCLLITDIDNRAVEEQLIKSYKKISVDSDTVFQINDRAIQQVNKLLIASDEWYLSQIAEINKGRNLKKGS